MYAHDNGNSNGRRYGVKHTPKRASLFRYIIFAIGIFTVFLMGIIIGSTFLGSHTTTKPWELQAATPSPAPPRDLSVPSPQRYYVRKAPAPPAPPPQPPLRPEVANNLNTTTRYIFSTPEAYGDFNSAVSFEASAPMDSTETMVGAWVWVSSSQRDNSGVIASNRLSDGCNAIMSHYGFTLAVVPLRDGTAVLRLLWGSRKQGCSELAGPPFPTDTWNYIAFGLYDGLDSDGEATLYLNDGAPAAKQAIPASNRALQSKYPVTFGAYSDGSFKFEGKLANVAVFDAVLSATQLAAVMNRVSVMSFSLLPSQAKSLIVSAVLFRNADNGVIGRDLMMGELKRLTWDAIGRNQVPSKPFPLSTYNREEPASPVSSTGGGDEKVFQSGDALPRFTDPAAAHLSLDELPPVTGEGNQWISKLMKMPSSMVTGPVSDTTALYSGTFSDESTAEEARQSDLLGLQRSEQVKAAMAYAWSQYKEHAWGADEILPKTGGRKDPWGGMGMTILDALDTLWIMDMKDEFELGKQWLTVNLDFTKVTKEVSFFETTIRAVGGMLSAYELSNDSVFLDKSRELVDKMLPAFQNGAAIPRAQIYLQTGVSRNPAWAKRMTPLAELGTIQLEYRYLSRHTRNDVYANKANGIIQKLHENAPANGLFPTLINPDTGTPHNKWITFGALGDSFYEYLLKAWIQGGKQEDLYLEMYAKAMDSMISTLLKQSSTQHVWFLTDVDAPKGGGAPVTKMKMDHLACFVPGMLALGAYNSAGTILEDKKWEHLRVAKSLMYTCWQLYDSQPTGLSPEAVEFPNGGNMRPVKKGFYYLLRPETAESLFILHQLTGNPIYREWGWKIFVAIETNCKLQYGYGSYADVTVPNKPPQNKQESFFFAETLKYLYMLQSPRHILSLDTYVLNTEAHPLKMFSKDGK